jgi:transcription elongation factor Elf1
MPKAKGSRRGKCTVTAGTVKDKRCSIKSKVEMMQCPGCHAYKLKYVLNNAKTRAWAKCMGCETSGETESTRCHNLMGVDDVYCTISDVVAAVAEAANA